MSISSSPFRVLAVALLSLAANLPAQSQRAPELPPGCEAIRVPEGNRVSLHAYALGVQTYRWNVATGLWDFVAPVAVLFADQGYHGHFGTHFGGPTWMSNSESKVVGARVASCVPDVTAISWLLLKAVSSEGPGPFDRTSFIQRVNTMGGLAPSRRGLPDEIVHVPYAAEYFFYREE